MQSNLKCDMDKAGNKVKKPMNDMKNQKTIHTSARKQKIAEAYEKHLENKKDEA